VKEGRKLKYLYKSLLAKKCYPDSNNKELYLLRWGIWIVFMIFYYINILQVMKC